MAKTQDVADPTMHLVKKYINKPFATRRNGQIVKLVFTGINDRQIAFQCGGSSGYMSLRKASQHLGAIVEPLEQATTLKQQTNVPFIGGPGEYFNKPILIKSANTETAVIQACSTSQQLPLLDAFLLFQHRQKV